VEGGVRVTIFWGGGRCSGFEVSQAVPARSSARDTFLKKGKDLGSEKGEVVGCGLFL
jgi:hypothetical protein